MLGHQTGAQKYRRNQAAVRLRRREKKESTGWGSRDGRGRRSWRMRERGEERGGGIKEEFCMSDYLERRRPFVTSRTLLPSKNHSTSWRAFIGGLRRDLRRDIASGRRGRGRKGEGRE